MVFITTSRLGGSDFGSNLSNGSAADPKLKGKKGGQSGVRNKHAHFVFRKDHSNSNFDVRNAFKGYAVYELPLGKGKPLLNNSTVLDEVVGGWQISATLVSQTGNPFSVDGTQNTYSLSSNASVFPNWNPGVSTIPANRTISNWFNPEAFIQPPDGTFGDVRRNSLYGPGLNVVNLSAAKTFSMPWEGVKFQIRGDAQNAFNHPSFGVPGDASLGGSSGAGTPYTTGTTAITSYTVGGRSLQVAARLTF
jgi:hypothetical protein